MAHQAYAISSRIFVQRHNPGLVRWQCTISSMQCKPLRTHTVVWNQASCMRKLLHEQTNLLGARNRLSVLITMLAKMPVHRLFPDFAYRSRRLPTTEVVQILATCFVLSNFDLNIQTPKLIITHSYLLCRKRPTEISIHSPYWVTTNPYRILP